MASTPSRGHVECPRVEDRAPDERQAFVISQVRPAPGREVVERDDGIAALDQPPCEVRPDEPRASRDEDLHVARPSALSAAGQYAPDANAITSGVAPSVVQLDCSLSYA